MTEADIEIALRTRAAGFTALPIAWPNQAAPAVKPYLALAFVRIMRTDDTLAQTRVRSMGRVIGTVVTPLNLSTATANGHADTFAALFPSGLRIAITDGEITFTKPADIQEGRREDQDWRTMVVIDYTASQ